jgi:hypothetical protein
MLLDDIVIVIEPQQIDISVDQTIDVNLKVKPVQEFNILISDHNPIEEVIVESIETKVIVEKPEASVFLNPSDVVVLAAGNIGKTGPIGPVGPEGPIGPLGPMGPQGDMEIYEQASQPSTTNIGAVWIDIDEAPYQWSPYPFVEKWSPMILRAFGFLQDQMRVFDRGTSQAKIKPNALYSYGYKGSVSGTFDLGEDFGGPGMVSPESWADTTYIMIDAPLGGVPDAYRGTVRGHLTIAQKPGDTISTYKKTPDDPTYYIQTSGTVVAADGTFSLSLSSVAANHFGYWLFALIRNGVQYGDYAPSQGPVYTDLQVEHNVIADMAYLVNNVPALANGTFNLPNTLTGYKQFRLKRKSTGALLADSTTLFGCIRSYLPYPGEGGYGTVFVNRCYNYDSSVSILAALAIGRQDVAKELVRGMLQMFTPQGASIPGAHPGGFSWSAMQTAPAYPYWDPVYRTGVHAWCTYALLCYVDACPLDTSLPYITYIQQALAYADTLLAKSGGNAGLYTGGSGRYDSTSNYDPNYILPWSGTEHQLDLWHMWDMAYKVFKDNSYAVKRDSLAQKMISLLWYPARNRLLQGIGSDGVPDTADPLDCHSWGAVWAHKIGRDDLARLLITDEALAPLYFESSQGAKGYGAYYGGPEGGYPGAVPTVWSEGSFGVALAHLAIGNIDAWRKIIEGLIPMQMTDGAFRYVTDEDVRYEMTTARSSIGSAWSILAVSGLWGTSMVYDV